LLASCASEQASEEAGDFVTSNGSPAGVYEVSAADGSTSIVTINAEGTYSHVTPDGGNAATGTLEVVDEQTCFKVRRPGSVPLCYTEGELAPDGSYSASTDSGVELTVRPYTAPEEGEDVAEEVVPVAEG
jgi:hypothetical protein